MKTMNLNINLNNLNINCVLTTLLLNRKVGQNFKEIDM